MINKIEEAMDKRRKTLEGKRTQQGKAEKPANTESHERALWDQALELGRIEGMAGALAVLRSSSLAHEAERSNERLGL